MIEDALSSMEIPFATPIALFFQYHAYEAVLLLAIITLPFFSRRGKHYAVVSSLVLAIATVYLLKMAYGLERPCGIFPAKVECPPDYSFPSGHVAVAFVFVAATLGTSLFPVYFPIALLVAFSRLYLGVHTIGDVMGGVVVGFVCYLAVEEFFDRTIGGGGGRRENTSKREPAGETNKREGGGNWASGSKRAGARMKKGGKHGS